MLEVGVMEVQAVRYKIKWKTSNGGNGGMDWLKVV